MEIIITHFNNIIIQARLKKQILILIENFSSILTSFE